MLKVILIGSLSVFLSFTSLYAQSVSQPQQSCAAFQEILDSMGSPSVSDPAKEAEINSGVMAAVAHCLIQEATTDEKNITALLRALNELPKKYGVSEVAVQSVQKLFSQRDNQSKNAVGFFTANALIQTAQSLKLLDFPAAKNQVNQVILNIGRFADRASGFYNVPSVVASETARLSAEVESVSQLASIVARRDMTASLSLRAKNYVRRIQQSKLPIDAGARPSSLLSATQTLDQLLSEINSAVYLGAQTNNFAETDAAWFESFDKRLITAIKSISPSVNSPEEAVQLWHSALKKTHSDIAPNSAQALETEVLIDLASDQMRSELYETAQALRRAIPELKNEIERSSGVIDNSIFGWTSQSLATLTQLDMMLSGFATRIRLTSSPEMLERSWRAKDQIKLLSTWTLEAAVSKSRTSDGLVTVLLTALNKVGEQEGGFLSPKELHQVHQIIQDQTAEGWVRAFINRQMITVYAHSTLLLAEAISIPFSGGGSAAAMPATLHSIVVGLQIVGKTTLIVTSALNISDRYQQDGIKGLVNPASALDAFTILMLLPRPIPGAVDSPTWFGRAIQNGNNQVAGWMHQASQIAIVGHGAFGAYQLTFAERIASSLRAQGYAATAQDVRRQALGHLAQAFLLGMVEFSEYQRGQALGGEHHSKMLSDSNPIQILLSRLRNMVFPHQAAIDSFNYLAPLIGKPLAAIGSVIPAAGYLAYDYIVASEAMMYFYAGSDFGYFSHIQSNENYPELAEGESAVTFIGFDTADMLYAGAHTIDSHLVETKKYGNQYFVYDFSSREDFLNKLELHARQHGPIKYLRIMTHGVPGKLYTGDVAASAIDETNPNQETAERDGWIDSRWIKSNSDRIKKLGLSSLAPNARVVLFACLVGSNLDESLPGLEQKAGDDFLKSLGENLLVQGGLIDASVRFLMGLDTVYGGLMNWSARDELIQSGVAIKHQPILPLTLYTQQQSGWFQSNENLRVDMVKAFWSAASTDGIVAAKDENDVAASTEMLKYSVSRMWKMLTQLHKLGIRYGVQLEGPWWSTPRYKHAKVTPNAAGLGVNVEIVTY